MRRLDQLILAVLIFAGICWGLWGVFEFNLVYYIFGKEWINRLVYFIFGVSALYVAIVWKSAGARWSQARKK